jgi:hypothetical protein
LFETVVRKVAPPWGSGAVVIVRVRVAAVNHPATSGDCPGRDADARRETERDRERDRD